MKNIGEEVRKRLTMDCLIETEYTGRVIYIHPSGRFYVAEFRLAGGTVRESFFEWGGYPIFRGTLKFLYRGVCQNEQTA